MGLDPLARAADRRKLWSVTGESRTTSEAPRRIDPERARELVRDEEALLVCAYAHDEKCGEVALPGSISYLDFKEMLPDLSTERALVFY